MNKLLVLFAFVFGLLVLPAFARSAVSNESMNATLSLNNGSSLAINESEVGSLPGDFSYGFKRFFEIVDTFFTFDNVGRAKKEAHYAQLRAAEAHILSGKAQRLLEENKSAEANATLQDLEQLMADEKSESDSSFTDLEAAVKEGKATDNDSAEVEAENRNSIEVLQRVYAKVPEQAKDGVLHALNNSINNEQKHEENLKQKRNPEKENEGLHLGEDNNNASGKENESANEPENQTKADRHEQDQADEGAGSEINASANVSGHEISAGADTGSRKSRHD